MSKVRTDTPQAAGLHLADGAMSLLRAVGRGFQAVIHAIQVARTLQALHQLTDFQLAEIGITRSEIPQYANRLLSPTPASGKTATSRT